MRLSLSTPLEVGAYPYAHPVRTRFAETDAMGIVHHASYLAYLEEARVAFLRQRGHPYEVVRHTGVDFAVLEAFVSYRQPLHFDELVDVHVRVGDVRRTTFQVGYLLQVGDEPRATAVTVHGAVDAAGRPSRLPTWVRQLADPLPDGTQGVTSP